VIIDAGHFVWEEQPAKYAMAVLDSITATGHDRAQVRCPRRTSQPAGTIMNPAEAALSAGAR
jgi:hypothetical protein